MASAQVSQGDCAFQAYPYRHGFQHGCSQVVSPVVGLCQYGAPEASSTCSSHPGGSGGPAPAGGGSGGGGGASTATLGILWMIGIDVFEASGFEVGLDFCRASDARLGSAAAVSKVEP